jgi:3-oxoacyl-[acyl-carrier protein] reductase
MKQAFIVTGSSSGVGAATALLLARQAAGVVINYASNAAPAQAVAEACTAAGGEAIVVRADVADDESCRRLAAVALEKFGRLDGLVNNAGTTKFAPMKDLAALTAEDFHRIYSVNTIGPYQMVRACEKALRESRGAVVNVSSIAGSIGIGSSYAYAASKGALNTLTLAMARALGPDVRVNAVLPGFIESNWLKKGLGENYEKAREAYKKASALNATLVPEEVAETIVWLLRATKATAQLITLDGGRTIGA